MAFRVMIVTSLFFSTLAFAQSELEVEKELSQEYLNKMKAEPKTVEIDDGILMREVYKSGSEVYPTINSKVKVLYQGLDRSRNLINRAGSV